MSDRDIKDLVYGISHALGKSASMQHKDMQNLTAELRRLNDILEKNTVEEVKDAVSTERED